MIKLKDNFLHTQLTLSLSHTHTGSNIHVYLHPHSHVHTEMFIMTLLMFHSLADQMWHDTDIENPTSRTRTATQEQGL